MSESTFCYAVTVLRKGTLPPLLKEENVSRHFAIQLQSRGDHSAIGLRFYLYRRFDVSRSYLYRRFDVSRSGTTEPQRA